jgi:hypothetical protein
LVSFSQENNHFWRVNILFVYIFGRAARPKTGVKLNVHEKVKTKLREHNGGNDRFSARLGILTILTIGFFVYGNQNYDSIGPEKCFFRIYHHAT